MSWIQDILDATAEVESPKSFIYWSSLAALSAVVKKNVFLDKFYYKLYPNIYTMLVTDSGGRKGFPIWLAEQMVLKVNNTRFIGGQNSIESIISSLAKAYSREGMSTMIDANAFIVSGEFHELLLENDSALTILTSLYDTHSRELWTKTTKSSGTESLKNVCITLLGASNEALLKKAVPEHAIEGGFMGRMLMIPDDKTGIVNPLTKAPKKKFNIDELIPYLKAVGEIKGEFHYNNASMKMYEDWYLAHRKKNRSDKTGTFNRLHDQILKVAMLHSLAEGTNLIISEQNLQDAIDKVEGFTQGVIRVAEGIGKSEIVDAMRIVLNELVAADGYKVSRTQLLRKHWGAFDSVILSRVTDHWQQAGAITAERRDNDTWYKLTQPMIDKYNRGGE